MGIGIAVLVVIVVASVTILSEKKSFSNDVASNNTVSQKATPVTQPVSETPQQENSSSDVKEVGDEEGSTTPVTPPVSTTPVATVPKKNTGSLYADGTYSAVGSYRSPGGPDDVGITVTLKNDIVVDTSTKEMAGDNRSARYEAIFTANYKPYVIGQNIDTLYLDKVSSSSLTPMGFNDAIAQIKSQARKS